jgi:putative hydroxymethylpyrimidine transport system substrate-binding protein
MNRTVAIVAACSIALAGCGARKERTDPASVTTFRVALSPLNAGENAVFAALRENYFLQGGVKANVTVAPDAASAIRKVQQGQADLAVTGQPDLLEARAKGARVTSIAALVQSPFTSLIGPQLTVASVTNLVTKPIGTAGLDYQRAMADTIFAKAGGHAHVVNVGGDLTRALTTKQVGAVIAQFGGPTLPRGVVVRPVDKLGVPTFSDYVLVANQAALDRDPDAIRSFIGALARGTRMLGSANAMGTAIPLRGAQVARTRALMLPPAGKPYGWQDPAKWRAFAAWMRAHRLPAAGAGTFTNRFLAGEGR